MGARISIRKEGDGSYVWALFLDGRLVFGSEPFEDLRGCREDAERVEGELHGAWIMDETP